MGAQLSFLLHQPLSQSSMMQPVFRAGRMLGTKALLTSADCTSRAGIIVSGHGFRSDLPQTFGYTMGRCHTDWCQSQSPLCAGLPGISLPCGFDDSSADKPLPVGLQIIGRAFGEAVMLKVAHAYEQTAGFASRQPAGLQ